MITVEYDRTVPSLRVYGHAGYAEKGSDIVCAAVSALSQALAKYVCDNCGGSAIIDSGELTVICEDDRAVPCFDLIADGIKTIARSYPENVCYMVLHCNG